MGKGKGATPQFDLAASLESRTFKKEAKKISKLKGDIEYNRARLPQWNVHESPEWGKMQELEEKVKEIEAQIKAKWEEGIGA